MLEFMGFMFCLVLTIGLIFGTVALIIEVMDHENELKQLKEYNVECRERIKALEAKSKRK